ncbi:site-specific integrase [Cryobacterium melibiosiphilum]|uniref:Site-specific integrase n=2 Tax=Cryobacterium melibiosiphilum TaxID=995039 RepID=A0A3A5MR75_9MICO|nr:site-specific integrase [Cryobacterium melibiosiphilum]
MIDLPDARFALVTAIDPERSMFDAMLDGWERQQFSRGLSAGTVEHNTGFIRRFELALGEYPWHWTATDVEDFTSSLLSMSPPRAHSTLRGYHQTITTFCDFLTDPRYDWAERCTEAFGTHPVQICHEWNTRAHLSEFEAKPAKRPFSYDELEAFFARADLIVEEIIQKGKKGALSALRDAQLFKTVYAFGLRRTEAAMLDLADLRSNPNSPQWAGYGVVHVRFGKAINGGPPRRRSVLAVPEFDWAIEGLKHWVEQARPKFLAHKTNALWISERKTRLSIRHLDYRFAAIRDQAGLDENLTLHSLRHSYVTHLIEFGYPERFVQEQVGHSYASTTAIYTSVSNDYKNRILASALGRVYSPTPEGLNQ